MATWLFNTLVGAGPPNAQVVNPSAPLIPDLPPSYEASATTGTGAAAGGAEDSSSSSTRQPRQPLALPALEQLRARRVVLASASPRRRALLGLLHLPNIEVVPSAFAEDLDKSHYTPWEYVLETATQKCTTVYKDELARAAAAAGSAGGGPDDEPALVLAADTVICLASGEVLEKPRNQTHHLHMLQALRDAGPHKVYTAVVAMSPSSTLAYPGYAMEQHVEETVVTFDRSVTDELLVSYVRVRLSR